MACRTNSINMAPTSCLRLLILIGPLPQEVCASGSTCTGKDRALNTEWPPVRPCPHDAIWMRQERDNWVRLFYEGGDEFCCYLDSIFTISSSNF